MPPSPVRPLPHRRSRIAGVVAVASSLALIPSPVRADIVIAPFALPGQIRPLLVVAPGGTPRTLFPAAAEAWAQLTPDAVAVSPDGAAIAIASGQKLAVVPAAGGPPRDLRVRAARLDATAGLSWSDDGSEVRSVATQGNPRRWVQLRCSIARGTCEQRRIAGQQVLSAIGGERLLTVPITPAAVRRTLGRVGLGWRPATTAGVRRDRRILSRPVADRIDVRAPGQRTRTVWRSEQAPRAGLWWHHPLRRGRDGALVIAAQRERFRLQTRARRGRLEARVDALLIETRQWLVDGAGRALRPVGPRTRRERDAVASQIVPLPDGRRLEQPDSQRARLLVVGPGDRRTTLGSALRPLLGERSVPIGGTLPPARSVLLHGYEAATDSAIVSITDVHDVVVARVPLTAGAVPSIVHRVTTKPRPPLLDVWAW